MTDLQQLYDRANALEAQGQFAEALADFESLLLEKPDVALGWFQRGNILQRLERFGDAIMSYERALALDKALFEAWCGKGGALHRLDRFEEAVASYGRAIRLEPDYGEAFYNRGLSFTELGLYAEAISDYDRAVRLDAHADEARKNKAISLLVQGRLKEGWPLYEARARRKDERIAARSQWQGQDISGKTLLLHHEQGLGDTIQFCRYARLCAARGAKVVMLVQTPLVGLLRQLAPEIRVIGPGELHPAFDFQCPMLSLPLAFATTLETIPANGPYLSADAAKMEEWRARLKPGAKPRIGIAWRGAPGHKNDARRSIPLEQWRGLLEANCDFIALQKEIEGADLDVAPGRIAIFGGQQKDFSDTAAMIALTDLVVTVDTSIAHLAGAMGKPVFILLPFNPDWRWLLTRSDSPWYASATLFRQARIGDWAEVMERVKETLPGLQARA